MSRYLKIDSTDNVAVALTNLTKGENLDGVTLLDDIKQGHKFALRDIKKNENIIKYGAPIGHASKDIKKGQHVHSFNLETNLSGELEYTYTPVHPAMEKGNKERFVKVFRRKFNQVGIRNNLVIVPLVGCINASAERIKNALELAVDKSVVDEIIVARHSYGCSQLGDDHLTTVKVLQSIVKHPNNGGVLVLSLGCENNQIGPFKDSLGEYDPERVRFLRAQDVDDEVAEGIKLCLELVERMKKDVREQVSINELVIGLKCGGSDGFSGITANPLVGKVSDYLTSIGGSTILTEVPEMFGAETRLMERADNDETFCRVVNLVNSFKKYYKDHNQVCYENPSPGNKEGGITTLEEKSLGCTQKSGHSEVKDVLYLGDQVKIKGLNLLNGPGNDMVACTNLMCAGAHLILFTTGRGTPFGTIVPTLKIATNSNIAQFKDRWIDFNAGQLLEGKSMEELREELLDYIVKVANNEIKSKNEINKFEEIAIFKDGVTL